MEEPRGNKPDGDEVGYLRAMALDESGSCLCDYEVGFMRSKGFEHRFKRRRAIVRYQTGEESERELAEVWVLIGKGKKMWADTITGTLFGLDGECRSSSRVRIVRWL